MTDETYLKQAVDEARRSKSEDGRPHPKVGVVVVSQDGTVTAAHRGELGAGDHAEFTVLEKKLSGAKLSGATVLLPSSRAPLATIRRCHVQSD
jgi:pyrimidine deaminase RibD-like protein